MFREFEIARVFAHDGCLKIQSFEGYKGNIPGVKTWEQLWGLTTYQHKGV